MSGPVAVFDGANHVLAQAGKASFYAVDVISSEGGLIRSSSGVTVQSMPRNSLDSGIPDTLLIMGARKKELMRAVADPGLKTWLLKLANKVPRLGSVCSGAFVLASLKVLDGRCVATHWNTCAQLAKVISARQGGRRFSVRSRRQPLDIRRRIDRHRHGAGDGNERSRLGNREPGRAGPRDLRAALRLSIAVQPATAGADEGRQPVRRAHRLAHVESACRARRFRSRGARRPQ